MRERKQHQAGSGLVFFCYGNEENGHCACTNGYLTTANQQGGFSALLCFRRWLKHKRTGESPVYHYYGNIPFLQITNNKTGKETVVKSAQKENSRYAQYRRTKQDKENVIGKKNSTAGSIASIGAKTALDFRHDHG